jgi:hypothetical protein
MIANKQKPGFLAIYHIYICFHQLSKSSYSEQPEMLDPVLPGYKTSTYLLTNQIYGYKSSGN